MEIKHPIIHIDGPDKTGKDNQASLIDQFYNVNKLVGKSRKDEQVENRALKKISLSSKLFIYFSSHNV